jgi:CRP-like cAMP-binding protein
MSLEVLAQMLGLKDRQSLDFIGILEMRRYCLGQTVFERGALGGEMLFILKGEADVRIPGFDGRDVRVALYNQGSMVGEMGFLDGQPRSATVTAVSNLSVAVLDRSAFDRFASEHSSAARQILMHVAMELNARLRRTNRIL